MIEDDVADERAGGRCAAKGRRIQLDARGGTARGVRRGPVVRAGGDGRNGHRRLPRAVLRGVEQGEYATSGGERALDLRHHARDLVERLGVLVCIRQEHLHVAHGEHGGKPRDDAHKSRDRHHRVHAVVDEPRARVRERTQKLRALARGVELAVDVRKALPRTVPIGKGAHQALRPHVLLDIGGQLALDAHLRGKAPPCKPGHRARREHGKRRDEHHEERHGNRGREHEDEGGRDGHHAVEQLR